MSQTGDVVRLVNEIRDERGLRPLTGNAKLAKAALRRATICARKGQLSHAGWVDSLRVVKFPWKSHDVGENLAYGQDEAAEVMRAWMDSAGHRDNILRARYAQIGVGVAEGFGERYWAQIFSD